LYIRAPRGFWSRDRRRLAGFRGDERGAHHFALHGAPAEVDGDGLTVLDQEVSSHLRASTALYFGQSPIEPSPCEPVLSGKLFRADGQELRGRMVDHLGFWDRFRGWLKPPYWQHVTLLLLSLIAAAIAHRLARVSQERLYEIVLFVRASLHRHRWFIVSAAAVWTVYAYVLFHGQAPFTYPRALCWFYDYQATSILQGRLDVPYVALPGEAYHIDGKFYGYFGITPALLRIPLLVLQIGFGNLTVPFMLAEQLGCLILAYLILCRLIARIRGPLSAPSPWAAVLLTANIGWGSNLFFLGSRGFLYHEAILCGVFFALASVYLAQRYRDDSGRRFWVGALLCGTLSVHARATVGFFALAFLGVSALELLFRERIEGVRTRGDGRASPWRSRAAKHAAIGFLSVLGFFSLNGLSYLKFKTLDAMPFQYNEQYSAERVARIEGKNFHLSNVPLNAKAYFLRPAWEFHVRFPYVHSLPNLPEEGSKARIDAAEPLLGLPFSMPGLFWLATGGLFGGLWRCRRERAEILALVLAVLPMTGLLLAAVATSQRYAADFCPFLICGASYGLVLVESLPRAWRRILRTSVLVLTVAAILVSLAITLRYQAELLWDVPDDVRQSYRDLGARLDRLFGVERSETR